MQKDKNKYNNNFYISMLIVKNTLIFIYTWKMEILTEKQVIKQWISLFY